MIEAFTLATAHHFGDALASQARLRYQTFVAHRKLPHHHYAGLEYDEFDTPAAAYLVWRDEAQVVRGLVRLLPTERPYMLQTYWPTLIEDGPLPASPTVWEATRVCVDRSLAPSQRIRVFPELFAGVDEFCAALDIESIIGVTRPHLVTHHYRTDYQWLGQPAEVEGEIERAFLLKRGKIRSRIACEKLAIPASVLRMSLTEPFARAA
jgi:N-acyl-L-homoserine lactone synthetase